MSADFWSAVEGQAVRAQPSGPVVDMTQPSTVESTSLPKKQVAATPKAKPVETTPLVEDVAAAAQTLRKDVPQPTSPDPIQAVYNTLLNNWGIPAAAAAYGAYKLMKDRPESARGPARRIEPTFNEPVIVPDKSAGALTNTAPGLTPGEQAYGVRATSEEEKRMLNRSLEAKMQKEAVRPVAPPAAAMPPAAVAPSTTPVAPAATPMAPAPAAPIPTTFAGAAVTEPPVTQTTKPQAIPATKAPKQPKATPVAPPLLTGAPEATPQGYYKGVVPPEVLERYKGMTGSGNNFLYNILGPQKFEQFLAQFNEGKGISDYKEALSKWNKYGPEFLQSFGPSMTKEIRKEKGIPPSNLGNFGKVGESGAITPGAALNLLGNALGAVGLVQAYKRGEQTGDWSDFGLGVIGQTLGNLAPKAATPFALMAPGGLNVGEQEELARRRGMAPTID